MNDIIDKITDYGSDIKGVMERFVNDEKLYIECLQEFICDETFQQLKASIKSKDFHNAFECAHTLKGVCGNLGLVPLYNELCNLVERLRLKRYDNIEFFLSPVYSELNKIIKIVSK